MHVDSFVSFGYLEVVLQTGPPWMASLLKAKLGFVQSWDKELRQTSRVPLLGAVSDLGT